MPTVACPCATASPARQPNSACLKRSRPARPTACGNTPAAKRSVSAFLLNRSSDRERDAAFVVDAAPQISLTPLADGFVLQAMLPAALLPAGQALQLGLTAVIEAADGSKHSWALAHCAAQPDFHVRQSFALTLKRNTP